VNENDIAQAAKDGNFVANAAELEHMAEVEESLYKWENIIDTVEEAQIEQPFTRRLFTMNKMEDWYLYRRMLITQISEFKHFFNLHQDSDIESEDDGEDNVNTNSNSNTNTGAGGEREQAFFDKNAAAAEGLL
jgi:hypothetical protein